MSSEELFRSLQGEKSKLERERNKQVEDAIKKMREELQQMQSEQAEQEKAETTKEQPEAPQPPDFEPAPSSALAPLIYFSYPLTGAQNPHPSWVIPLRTALVKSGYHVYTPWISAEEQFTDGHILDQMPKKLVSQLCSALRMQEEVLLDFDTVKPTLMQADRVGDFDCVVFRSLWFLCRTTLMIADITAPERLGLCGVLPEMVYARMLDVPVIGVAAESGYTNPWLTHCTSVIYTGQFNLAKFSPLIRGFAPLPA
jgi:hypothetical protein